MTGPIIGVTIFALFALWVEIRHRREVAEYRRLLDARADVIRRELGWRKDAEKAFANERQRWIGVLNSPEDSAARCYWFDCDAKVIRRFKGATGRPTVSALYDFHQETLERTEYLGYPIALVALGYADGTQGCAVVAQLVNGWLIEGAEFLENGKVLSERR